MKTYISIILFALTFGQCYAQNNLSGQVAAEEDGQPLIGAHVYIPDIQKGTTTDLEGNFMFEQLPKGTFLVEVGYLGFSNRVIRVHVEGHVHINIELAHAAIEMAEVVVTGPSASTERQMNPIPTLVVDEISSNKVATTNVIDAISKLPGIDQVSTGGAISKPVIRGLGFNRVIVLNNNIRQEGQQWGEEHGIEIDEYSVDRVEIIKGPGSLKYGSDAMAGVIHFLPPKPTADGEIVGNVMANYQTNNHMQGYSAMNAGNLNGIHWLGRVSLKKAGNYQNPYDGYVYNSGFDELNFNGSLGINKKWGFTRLNFSRFDQTLGMVEGERDEMGRFVRLVAVDGSTKEEVVPENDLKGYGIGIPRQGILHQKVSSNSKVFFNRTVLSMNLGFQQNSRKEFEDILHEDEAELDFLLNTFNYEVQYLLPEKNGWLPSIGLNGMIQKSLNEGEEFLIPEYDLWDVGAFGYVQKTMDKWYLNAGVRYDIRRLNSASLFLDANDEPTSGLEPGGTVRFQPFDRNFSNISASAGISYRLTDELTAKLNLSRGFRSPNMSELGSNGIHEGTFRYEVGNNKLNPETSLQWDAGLVFNNEHLSVEMGVFHNTVHDYIYLQKMMNAQGGDSVVIIDQPVEVFHYVQGDARLYGGEIVVDVHPHPLDWLHFENSFSYVRGQLKNQPEESTSLPFMPAPKFHSEIRTDFQDVGSIFKNLYFRLGLDHVFKQEKVFSAYNTETPSNSYTLLHVGIGADIRGSNDQTLFTISVAGSNLLDQAYQSHLSRLKYAPENPATGRMGIYNMGRNISMRLVVPLEFKNKS